MAHPTRFDEDDPILTQLRELCLALPEADEKISHGRPAFYTKKIFAGYGAVLKGDHGLGPLRPGTGLHAASDDAEALGQDDRFFSPAYWGPSGWMGLDLGGDVDWTEVAELVEESFRLTAPKRAIAQLDERS